MMFLTLPNHSPYLLPTISASLQFCGLSPIDYFYHPSVHSCVYPLILEEIISFPLIGLIPEAAVLLWHLDAVILLSLSQLTVFLTRNSASWVPLEPNCISWLLGPCKGVCHLFILLKHLSRESKQ